MGVIKSGFLGSLPGIGNAYNAYKVANNILKPAKGNYNVGPVNLPEYGVFKGSNGSPYTSGYQYKDSQQLGSVLGAATSGGMSDRGMYPIQQASNSSGKSSGSSKPKIQVNGAGQPVGSHKSGGSADKLKKAGFDPASKKQLYKQYGVDNVDDFLKAVAAEQAKKASVLGASAGRTASSGSSLASLPMDMTTMSGEVPGAEGYDEMLDTTQEYGRSELQGVDDEYDYLNEQYENQLKGGEGDFNLGKEQLANQKTGYLADIGMSKKEQQDYAQSSDQDALGSAKEVERANRNMLRGLGILGSSAAGELLSKPFQQYDQVRGKIYTNLQTGIQKLDNFAAQKTSELDTAATKLLNDWQTLQNNIKTDMRFSAKDRVNAIAQAKAAISEKLSQIKMAKQNYTDQVNTQKQNFAYQLMALKASTNPSYDYEGAMAKAGGNTGGQPQQVGTYEEDDEEDY